MLEVGELRDEVVSGLQPTINNVAEIVGDVNNIAENQIPNMVNKIEAMPEDIMNQVSDELENVVDKIFIGLSTLDVEYQEALTLGSGGNIYNDGTFIDIGGALNKPTDPQPILKWEFNGDLTESITGIYIFD